MPVVVNGPTDIPVLDGLKVPFHPSAPLPPLAVQLLALLVVHANELDCPTSTALGDALSEVTLPGGVALATVTLTDTGTLAPPEPVQLSVYTSMPALFRGPIAVPELLIGSALLHPSDPVPPLPVQALAPLVLQLNELDPPAVMTAGAAAKATIAAGGGAVVTVSDRELTALKPPAPLQVKV